MNVSDQARYVVMSHSLSKNILRQYENENLLLVSNHRRNFHENQEFSSCRFPKSIQTRATLHQSMPSIFGKPQNVSRWLANIENFHHPRTANPIPVSGLGELLLTLPCSLQLAILLRLDMEDVLALRLVSRSFEQLAKRYTDAVSFAIRNCAG